MAELTAVETLKEWVKNNRAVLEEAKIESILGEYGGSGDEGIFEGVSFEPLDKDGKVSEALRAEVLELMEEVHDEVVDDGYGNDEGGGGELKLVVATGELLHSEYYFTTTREYTVEDQAI